MDSLFPWLFWAEGLDSQSVLDLGSVIISLGCVRYKLVLLGADFDEPESLILAQSERWRHA